jgi:hypothetical protein
VDDDGACAATTTRAKRGVWFIRASASQVVSVEAVVVVVVVAVVVVVVVVVVVIVVVVIAEGHGGVCVFACVRVRARACACECECVEGAAGGGRAPTTYLGDVERAHELGESVDAHGRALGLHVVLEAVEHHERVGEPLQHNALVVQLVRRVLREEHLREDSLAE